MIWCFIAKWHSPVPFVLLPILNVPHAQCFWHFHWNTEQDPLETRMLSAGSVRDYLTCNIVLKIVSVVFTEETFSNFICSLASLPEKKMIQLNCLFFYLVQTSFYICTEASVYYMNDLRHDYLYITKLST